MTGTITELEAKDRFLDFVDAYEEANEGDLAPLGYRLDTWQMWVKCSMETHDERFEQTGLPCLNPGLSIEVDAPSEAPFVAHLGPYELFREQDIGAAFWRLLNETTPYIQMSAGHTHLYGQPHHIGCTLCGIDATQPPPA